MAANWKLGRGCTWTIGINPLKLAKEVTVEPAGTEADVTTRDSQGVKRTGEPKSPPPPMRPAQECSRGPVWWGRTGHCFHLGFAWGADEHAADPCTLWPIRVGDGTSALAADRCYSLPR